MNKGQLRDVIDKVEAGTSTAAERNALLAAIARFIFKNFIRAGSPDSEEISS